MTGRGPVHAAIRPRVCGECPFRRQRHGAQLRDGLTVDRRTGIVESLHRGESFVCHMEAHELVGAGPAGARQCTGAAAVLEREGAANAIMVVAARFGEPPFEHPVRSVVPWESLADWATGPPLVGESLKFWGARADNRWGTRPPG